MSKTLSDVARMMRGSNEDLFDRYINIRLSRDKPMPSTGFATFRDTSLSKAWDVLEGNVSINDLDFQIICPRTGLKPNITVTGQWNVSNTINNITVTIYNMDANIDTMAYNFAEIDVGYYNSGVHVSFIGQITNCYMAKPNPNGELVITVTCADVQDLYAQGDFEVQFDLDKVDTATLINTCVNAMCAKYPELRQYCADVTSTLPVEWSLQDFTVGKGTRHFRSCMECLNWLNSLFATFTVGTSYASSGTNKVPTTAQSLDKALAPLKLGFDEGSNLRARCSYSEATPMSIKALYAIGSATLTSENATLVAPFNPGILPGEVIAVDARYFRTRVNIDSVRDRYKNMSALWNVIQTQFAFSTHSVNTMTLLLNNIKNKVEAKAG